LSWRDPLLWRVALLLAAAGALYYVGNIFLPQILSRAARLSLIDPGLTGLNGVQLLSSAVLMGYADRLPGSSWPLLLTLALGLLSIPALLWLPGLGVIAAAGLLGIAASALYVLAITLPAWLVPLEQVARMAAGVTVVANVLTFVLPAGAAWLSDATDSIALGFLPIAVIIVLSMLAPLGIKPRRADAAATWKNPAGKRFLQGHQGVAPAVSAGRRDFLLLAAVVDGAANQVVESADRSLGAFADGDHDLLVRHGGHVAGSEYARHRGLAPLVDHDLAEPVELDGALEPVGVRQQADLDEHAVQLELVQLVGFAVLVG